MNPQEQKQTDMRLTNQQIQTIYFGLQNILLDTSKVEDKGVSQRHLPMLPSVRVNRMKDDLESYHETVEDQQEAKNDRLDEYRKELKEKVDDEEEDYSADDMREDLNSEAEELSDELSDIMEKEVDVDFSDPLTESDIQRLDECGENFPSVSSSAISLLMKKLQSEDGDK